MTTSQQFVTQIPESRFSRYLFSDTRLAIVWLLLRMYVGYEWLRAGLEKMHSDLWVGTHAGVALKGFLMGALQKTLSIHPDVQGWYGWFISHEVLPNVVLFSYLVTFGEIAVGIALTLGLFTGIAAFFGSFMNMNYLFAGTVSINPLLFLCELGLILAWRVAGWYGLDRMLLPFLGTPWTKGQHFERDQMEATISILDGNRN